MANLNSPRDGSRIPAILVKDTVSSLAVAASGILAGSTEAQAVAIVDGTGAQITTFGGGTQYTDGGVPPAHPVGNTIEWSDGSNWQTVSTAKPLPVTASFSGTLGVTQSTSPWVVSNGGTFAVQATLAAETTKVIGTVNIAASQTIAVTNTGTFAVQATLAAETTKVIGVTRTADGSGNLITSTGNALDINIKTGNPTTITATQATGTNLHTVVDSGTITAVTAITNALPAGTNNIGLVTPTPTSNTGWSFNYQSALSSTKAQIKATAGTFGGYINLYNPNTAVTFIQVFNLASASVTVGTTAPDFVITLPGIAAAAGTGTDRNLEITCGLKMSTGITIAATTTATGSSAPANAITATFLFL